MARRILRLAGGGGSEWPDVERRERRGRASPELAAEADTGGRAPTGLAARILLIVAVA